MALSPIFDFAERFVTQAATLDPTAATRDGVAGDEFRFTDVSPAGYEARAAHRREALGELAALPQTNDDDRRAREFIGQELETELAHYDTGEWRRGMNAIASPITALRGAFDLMNRDGGGAWEAIASRLAAVPATLDGLRETYESGRVAGEVAPVRQALAVAAQCRTWAANRWFDTLAAEASRQSGLDPALVGQIGAAADRANSAFGAFGDYLATQYAPSADPADGCGPERYALGIRTFLGARLDPVEMYEWAWTEFHALRAEIAKTCAQILPGAGFPEVVELLETDPARSVHGAEAYQAWLQEVTDDALARSAPYFDIPEVMNRCEALIPPEGSAAAAYYTSPTEDFSRPGRTWYPLLGRTSFATWGEVTTCYHESVPGHHLQLGYAKYQADSLSRVQRNAFVSGHGEGWALYAERLCDEFGWFENPDHRLGFLSGQMLRTVRVIVDIGMHLGYRIPAGTTSADGSPFHGGEVWNPQLAFEFAVRETGNTEAFMASEIDRYLGWPAQAISYKIGEREWMAIRDDARKDSAFDLKAWHMRALALGPMGLDQLRRELTR